MPGDFAIQKFKKFIFWLLPWGQNHGTKKDPWKF